MPRPFSAHCNVINCHPLAAALLSISTSHHSGVFLAGLVSISGQVLHSCSLGAVNKKRLFFLVLFYFCHTLPGSHSSGSPSVRPSVAIHLIIFCPRDEWERPRLTKKPNRQKLFEYKTLPNESQFLPPPPPSPYRIDHFRCHTPTLSCSSSCSTWFILPHPCLTSHSALVSGKINFP